MLVIVTNVRLEGKPAGYFSIPDTNIVLYQ